MKIGILYICTGKYSVFWETFYHSSEEYLLGGKEKHYFVFTEDRSIKPTDKIHVIYEKPKGFPMDSLMRFKMFVSIEEQLKEMDYLFFFNSNMQIVKDISEEILPKNNISGLMGFQHPGYFNKKPIDFPYEHNKKSKAFIKYSAEDKYYYFMGSFNGGRSKDFLEMSHTLSKAIEDDMSHEIIAIYHDESHLNQYFHKKDILVLDSSYGVPEDTDIGYDPKILILNKVKHAGKYFDKLPKTSYFLRFRKKLVRKYYSLIWKFK